MSLKVRSRRFMARYFGFLAELVYWIKINSTTFKNPPIIIITPGKVGSSSVWSTLKKETNNAVYHIHQLSKEGVEGGISRNLNSARKSRPLHLIIAKQLRKRLKRYDGDMYIITLVREPISRVVSSFFQNTELYKNEVENKKLKIDIEESKKIVTTMLQNNICGEVEQWFDKEIKENFGIDVFAQNFDELNKYVITHNGRYHHLLLKMEDLNKVFPRAIKDFLNLDSELELHNTNIGQSKHYAEAYNEVKNMIKLDSNELEHIVNSKYFQHFYKDQESNVKKKWIKLSGMVQ